MAKEKIAETLGIEHFDPDSNDVIEYEDLHNIDDIVAEDDLVVNKSIINNSTIDYKATRKSMKSLIETGESVVPDLANLAKESESARAYEVLFSSIKTLGEMNKKLLELNKQQQEIAVKDELEKPSSPSTVNQNLFVGSTEELLEFLNKKS